MKIQRSGAISHDFADALKKLASQDPKYDNRTLAIKQKVVDKEAFDYGFHAGWHGGGNTMEGMDESSFEAGKKEGFRQSTEASSGETQPKWMKRFPHLT